jgi:hypothetical protein
MADERSQIWIVTEVETSEAVEIRQRFFFTVGRIIRQLALVMV